MGDAACSFEAPPLLSLFSFVFPSFPSVASAAAACGEKEISVLSRRRLPRKMGTSWQRPREDKLIVLEMAEELLDWEEGRKRIRSRTTARFFERLLLRVGRGEAQAAVGFQQKGKDPRPHLELSRFLWVMLSSSHQTRLREAARAVVVKSRVAASLIINQRRILSQQHCKQPWSPSTETSPFKRFPRCTGISRVIIVIPLSSFDGCMWRPRYITEWRGRAGTSFELCSRSKKPGRFLRRSC